MSNFYIFSKLILPSIILFNFSCALVSQNRQANKPENVELTKTEPLPPLNHDPELISEGWKIPAENVEASPQRKLTAQELEREMREAIEARNERIEKIMLLNRDVTRYEKDIASECYSLKCQRRKGNFIWEHLKNRKQGYTKDFIQGIDLAIAYHIFIEPDERGQWQVIWKTVITRPFEDADISEETFGENFVERVRTKSKKGGWKLVFKNSAGEIKQTL